MFLPQIKIQRVEAWAAIKSPLSAVVIDPLGDVFTALQKWGGAMSCYTYKENRVCKSMFVSAAEIVDKCQL